MVHLGILLPRNKKQKIQLPEKIERLCQEKNIKITELSIDSDNGIKEGCFDVLLHKVTDYYNEFTAEEADIRIEKFREYILNYPKMIVIDDIEGCIKMTDRKYQTQILKACKITLDGIKVFVPKIIEIPVNTGVKDAEILLTENGVKFPVIAKPITASLADGSHQMMLIFSKASMKDLPVPCLVQEFCKHGGVVYKVYVIGEHFYMCERPSIKDIDNSSKTTLIFDTRNVSKTGKAYIPDLHVADPNLREWLSCDDCPNMLNRTVINELCHIIRCETKLKLFGFDVLIEKDTGNYALIDVNHFPGYKGINEKYFAQDLVELILHEGTKKT